MVQKKALRGDRNNEGPILKDRMNQMNDEYSNYRTLMDSLSKD